MSFPKGIVPTTGIWDPETHSGVCFKYGLPENCTVHPTPLYELIVSCAIGWLLWRLGARYLKRPGHAGEVFCYYLILTGVARFLVEIIRINPPWIFGMSNAQVASAISVLGGLILLVYLRRASTANS
jgi:phosphatidylglycerol:prolipoprotein diacylglycerol transferase